MRKIAVITPISHLDGVYDLLLTKGDVYLMESSSKSDIRNILITQDIDTIVCNPNQQCYKIDSELLQNSKVTTINSCSTGLNHIDLVYCKNNNIEIQCHKNDFELINELPSTSELAFGLMLSLLRKIPHCQKDVSKYKWDYTHYMGRQIKDLNIGIVGYGRLGKMMFKYCEAFGANVKIYDPYVYDDLSDSFKLNNLCLSLDELFKFSDVISLHVHVTSETKNIINKDLFGFSNKNLYIVNTSRGEIVNEVDVVDALKSNKISGYATDVVEHEFSNLNDSPIIKSMNDGENIIVTPHIGGMTVEGQTKAYKWSINKL